MFSHCDAVIFDCDGVLVDSEYLCHVALSHALKEVGIVELPDSLFEEFSGVQLTLIFTAVEKRQGRQLPPGFESRYRAIVAELFERELQPVKGIEALLEQLSLPYCVASNGPLAKMEHSLKLTGLRDYFGDRLFSAYEVGAWKPAPGLFLAAASSLGVVPERCLVVEDSPVGVQAARAAGMSVLRYGPETKHAGADVPSVRQMSQIPELLGLPR